MKPVYLVAEGQPFILDGEGSRIYGTWLLTEEVLENAPVVVTPVQVYAIPPATSVALRPASAVPALQSLMRHKNYQTTQLYVNMARQLDAAVAVIHIPEVLKTIRGDCRSFCLRGGMLEGRLSRFVVSHYARRDLNAEPTD